MGLLILFIISLFVPASIFLTALTSFAGIYNYMEVVVGEKAAGMGGAFTAVADDATATYYNPAGIIHIPFNSMSASANAMTFKTRKGKFFLSNKEELTSFDFIPNFWGVTASTSVGKDRPLYSQYLSRITLSFMRSIPISHSSDLTGILHGMT